VTTVVEIVHPTNSFQMSSVVDLLASFSFVVQQVSLSAGSVVCGLVFSGELPCRETRQVQMKLARIAPDPRCGELEFQFRLCRVDGTAAHGTHFTGPVSAPRSVGRVEREDFCLQRSTRAPAEFLGVMTVEHANPR